MDHNYLCFLFLAYITEISTHIHLYSSWQSLFVFFSVLLISTGNKVCIHAHFTILFFSERKMHFHAISFRSLRVSYRWCSHGCGLSKRYFKLNICHALGYLADDPNSITRYCSFERYHTESLATLRTSFTSVTSVSIPWKI